jgi:hypothetical protein
LRLPIPEGTTTPKGAFAGLGQSDADYDRERTVSDQGNIVEHDKPTMRVVPALQLELYNDGQERSRVIVQLAGTENSSIYSVNKSMDDPDCVAFGCIPGGDSTEGSPGEVTGDDTAGTVVDGLGGSLVDDTVDPGDDGPTPEAAFGGTAGGAGLRPSGNGGGLGRAFGFAFARRSLGDGALMTSFLLLAAGAAGSVGRRRRLLGLLTLR